MVKERRLIADYLNVGTGAEEKYALMGTGFTDLNDSPSAQTTSKKYINNKSASKSISGYDWTAAYTTDVIPEEEAIKYICNIGKKELIGADAETNYVKVDLTEKVGSSGTEFEARRRRIAVEVAEFASNDGEMQASGNLLGQTDWEFGKFDIKTKTFTPEAEQTPAE